MDRRTFKITQETHDGVAKIEVILVDPSLSEGGMAKEVSVVSKEIKFYLEANSYQSMAE